MLKVLVTGAVAFALATMSAHAEVSLFKGVIGKQIERAVDKATEPERPANCRPIRGRPQNDERCRMA